MTRYSARRIHFGLLGSVWGVWDRSVEAFVKHPQMDLMKWHTDSKRKATALAEALEAARPQR